MHEKIAESIAKVKDKVAPLHTKEWPRKLNKSSYQLCKKGHETQYASNLRVESATISPIPWLMTVTATNKDAKLDF